MNPETLVLVAPRPVRLATPAPFSSFTPSFLHRPQAVKSSASVRLISAPTDAFDNLKLSSDSDEDLAPQSSERDRSISPRLSSLIYVYDRLTSPAPSEAMEEFLSILRPTFSIFPPTSPILRPGNGIAHDFVPYRRGLSSAMSNEGLGLSIADQSDDTNKENEMVSYPFRLLASSPLSSPITRAHNPFPRHPAFDGQASAFLSQHSASSSPSPISMALSPATVPLPLPTPEEMDHELP
ncbi:hypothetical protein BDW22DRAFT_1429957 [Trametopsis cervina]|nr:hypothetical protein BDW22DRAFT_1429957 [Trametopsis cervina]